MKRNHPFLLAILALLLSSLACQGLAPATSLDNLRLAHDEFGDEVTSTFADTDDFFAVVDIHNAPRETVVKAVWTAVEVDELDPDFELQEHTLDVTQESFSGKIYFQLVNDDIWPSGLYRVDIYVNDMLTQSLEFNVE